MKKKMKVIICGWRDFEDYELLRYECDKFFAEFKTDEFKVCSGKQTGADTLGERYAKERGYEVISFPADWDKYGNPAGPIRNTQMAKYADACIAFLHRKSKGTKNMIKQAMEHGLTTEVVDIV